MIQKKHVKADMADEKDAVKTYTNRSQKAKSPLEAGMYKAMRGQELGHHLALETLKNLKTQREK